MSRGIINERDEIIQALNLEEFTDLINEQIVKGNIDYSCVTDNFRPIYARYRSIKSYDMNPDIANDLDQEFDDFCIGIIQKIQDAFNIHITENWFENHKNDIPAISLMLYSFFILELTQNLVDSIKRFIFLNVEDLYPMFEDRKGKKDAATALYTKSLSVEKAVLMANIYDVTTHVIETMTMEEFLEYLPDGYVPREVLKKLFDSGDIAGDFMVPIREMFNTSVEWKSIICFNIEFEYRRTVVDSQ